MSTPTPAADEHAPSRFERAMDFVHRHPRRALLGAGIVASTGATLAAIALRIARTGRITFFFLSWNLFLAWVPWLCAVALSVANRRRAHPALLWALALAWLAFFPNAPYLLTDFVHLRAGSNSLWWYDLLFLSTATAAGWLCAVDGLDRVASVLVERFGRRVAAPSLMLACWLAGLGVYLGRFLRFNSWDVLSNPAPLAGAIADRFAHPLAHPMTHGFAVLFGGMLLASYAPLAVRTLRLGARQRA